MNKDWKAICKKRIETTRTFSELGRYYYSIKKIQDAPKNSPYSHEVKRSAWAGFEGTTFYRGTWRECSDLIDRLRGFGNGLARKAMQAD